MRIVAGSVRGRRLLAPPGRTTRPTSDRVREAVFNALGSMDALVDATVVDLFAGSGALGLEALSRGAARATFVESDRTAADVLRRNVAACGMEHRARVVCGDVARADIDALAQKYMGTDEYPNPIQSERVILQIAVDKVHKNGY